MEIQLDFEAISCTMASEGTLVSSRGVYDGYHPPTMVDIQVKMSFEQAHKLYEQVQRLLLLVELEDV